MAKIKTTALLAGLFVLVGVDSNSASNAPNPSDFYMISRDDNRVFRGSHKVYKRMSDGLVQVQYCGRPYWVRYATVAWTQIETENRYQVRVESNWGKGWRPICENPEEQVTLRDLGINEDPRVIVQNDGVAPSLVSRFSVIRDSFRVPAGEENTKSFHQK